MNCILKNNSSVLKKKNVITKPTLSIMICSQEINNFNNNNTNSAPISP